MSAPEQPTRFAILTGRAFGKTNQQRTLLRDIDAPDNATDQTRAKLDAAKAKTRGEQRRLRRLARVACPHAVVRYKQVPHPRYGAAVPHFTSWVEPLREPHPCASAWGAR